MRYIAFLRAINVGGHSVSMERLRGLFAELGLRNVGSYIQTGNLFFETDESDRAVLTARIERYLEETLGYSVPAMLRTADEVDAALATDPFKGIEVTPDVRLCVAFLSGPLSVALPHASPKGDLQVLSACGDIAFAVIRILEPGKVPDLAKFIEKAGGAKATVRFFHTTAKILEASRK